MSIYVGSNKAVLVKGDYKPAALYRGGNKIAGWHDTAVTASGTVEGTYNDFVGGEIRGATELRADWRGLSGALSQAQTTQGKNLYPLSSVNWKNYNLISIGEVKLLPGTYTASLQSVVGAISWRFCFRVYKNGVAITESDYLHPVHFVMSHNSYYTNAGVFYWWTSDNNYLTETFTIDDTYTVAWFLYSGNTTSATVGNQPMIELGNTATSYAPFVPNSPSPEYPAVVTVPPVGKNLFKTGIMSDYIALLRTISEMNLLVSGNAVSGIILQDAMSAFLNSNTYFCAQGQTFTMSAIFSAGATKRYLIRCLDYAGNILTTGLSAGTYNIYYKAFYFDDVSNAGKFTFTINSGAIAKIQIGSAFVSSVLVGSPATVSNIQLELGSVATSYESYKPRTAGNYKVPCPTGGYWSLNLSDDLREIGTYPDKYELDVLVGRGQSKSKVIKAVLDGVTRKVGINDFNTGSYMYFVNTAINTGGLVKHIKTQGICTHFSHTTLYPQTPALAGKFSTTLSENSVYFDFYGIVSADNATLHSDIEANAWLAAQYAAGTPVTVYYVADTETVTPITLTHVDSSDLPKLALSSLGLAEQTPDYPYSFVDSEGGTLTTSDGAGQETEVTLPIVPIGTTLQQTSLGTWEREDGWAEYTFTGAEAWNVTDIGNSKARAYLNFSFGAAEGLCTHFPYGDVTVFQDTFDLAFGVYARFNISKLPITTAAECKTYIAAQYAAGTPWKIRYKRATPIVTTPALGPLKTYPQRTDVDVSYVGVSPALALTANVAD